MRYHLIHRSAYSYTEPAALSLNEACLGLRPSPFQTVISRSFSTEPPCDYHRERLDWFGNSWRLYAFEKPHTSLVIETRHEVEVSQGYGGGDGSENGYEPYLYPSPFIRTNKDFASYGRASFPQGTPTRDGVLDLCDRLHRDIRYDPKATTIATPVETFFAQRRGVCQDYAHLMVAILRSLGIPARYVSGYLNTVAPPGKEKVLGADASHAWVSAWIKGHGWVDMDPTNGVSGGQNHITLAWGRDYGDVTPLKGVVLGGGIQKLKVEVTVLANP